MDISFALLHAVSTASPVKCHCWSHQWISELSALLLQPATITTGLNGTCEWHELGPD